MSTNTLQVSTPSDREVAMTRVFDAPRALVYEALTNPELLRRWFSGPPGWSLTVCEADLRVGGTYRNVWRGPDGTEMGLSGVYQIVEPPARIVATEAFDQAWYPGEAVSSIVLVEHDGQTTLTMTVRYDSKETRDMVLQTPMAEGVSYGYSKLAELLATLPR